MALVSPNTQEACKLPNNNVIQLISLIGVSQDPHIITHKIVPEVGHGKESKLEIGPPACNLLIISSKKLIII